MKDNFHVIKFSELWRVEKRETLNAPPSPASYVLINDWVVRDLNLLLLRLTQFQDQVSIIDHPIR